METLLRFNPEDLWDGPGENHLWLCDKEGIILGFVGFPFGTVLVVKERELGI